MKMKDHFTMTLRGKEMIVIASVLQEQLRRLEEAVTVIKKSVADENSPIIAALHGVYTEMDILHSRFVDAIHNDDPDISQTDRRAH